MGSSGNLAAPETLQHLNGPVVGVTLLGNGSVAAVSDRGRIVVVDPSRRTPERNVELGQVATAMASDGSRLFVTTDDGQLLVVDLSSSDSPAVHGYRAHSGTAKSVAVSADGRLLATGGDDRQIALWRVEPGMPQLARLSGHTDMVTALAFSPDGTRLASASQDQTVRLWDLDLHEELGEAVQLTASPGLAFLPGTQRLAVAGEGLTLWPMDPGSWRRTACDVLGERRLTQPEIEQYLRGSSPAPSC
jgi:WD40 repeat protein